MESILVLMSDESLNGNLGPATKLFYLPKVQKPVVYDEDLDWKISAQRFVDTYSEKYLPPVSHENIDWAKYLPKELLSPKPIVEEDGMNEYECAFDVVLDCLSQCLHRHKRKRFLAEKAIELVEKHKITKVLHFGRGLVYFPDLLERFLNVQKEMKAEIHQDDLACMFARCIEHKPEDTHARQSIKHLIAFKGDQSIEIKLLPGRYPIDNELYELIRWENVQDSYYDATMELTSYVYTHQDIVKKEDSGLYTGFRDAYHALLYGGAEHLQALIVRWDLFGDEDCTVEAAREFFHLAPDCSIDIVKNLVNKKSM